MDADLLRVWDSLILFDGGAARGAGGGVRSGQCLLLTECASPELEHLSGEARQHVSMALTVPPLGHEGLG